MAYNFQSLVGHLRTKIRFSTTLKKTIHPDGLKQLKLNKLMIQKHQKHGKKIAQTSANQEARREF